MINIEAPGPASTWGQVLQLARMLLRDRRRMLVVWASLFLVALSLPASLVATTGASGSLLGEAVKLTAPNIEVVVSYYGYDANVDVRDVYAELSGMAARASEVIDALDGLVEGGGAFTAYPVAYIYSVPGDCRNPPDTLLLVRGDSPLLLYVYQWIPVDGEACPLYAVSLYLASFQGDPLYAGISLVEGEWPTPGGPPYRVAVYRGFAQYMGWSPGDRVEFQGVDLLIAGVYDYNGGIQGLRTAWGPGIRGVPAMVSSAIDFTSILESMAEYAISHAESLQTSYYIEYGYDAEPPSRGSSGITPHYGLASWANDSLDTGLRDLAKEGASLVLLDLYATVSPAHLASIAQERGQYTRFTDVEERFTDAVARLLGVQVSGFNIEGIYWSEASSGYGTGLQASLYTDVPAILDMASASYLSPIGTFSLVSVSISVLVIGYLAASHVLEIVIGDLRPTLALLVARGVPGGSLKRALSIAVLAAGALAVLAGVLVTLLVAQSYYASSGLPSIEPAAVLRSTSTWAAAGVAVALTFVAVYRSRIRRVAEIRPVEAVRRVEAVKAAASGKARKGVSAFIVAIVFSVLVVGIAGGPEALMTRLEGYGTPGVAIAIIVTILALFGVPFAPIASVYIAVRALEGNERLYDALSRAARIPAGPLSPPAAESARSLADRLRAVSGAAMIALGAAIGSALAWSATGVVAGQAKIHLFTGGSGWALQTLAGLHSAMAQLRVLAIYSLGVALVSLYALYESTFRLIRGEVVVLRVRGASKGQALRFVYGMLLPSSLYIALVGLASGAFFYVVTSQVYRMAAAMGPEGIQAPILPGPLSLFGGLVVLASLSLAPLLPLVVSYGVARARDLARLLRETGLS